MDSRSAKKDDEADRVRVKIPFDEAIRRALKVKPPADGWAKEAEREKKAKRKRRRRKA